MNPRRIQCARRPLDAVLQAVPSKSMTHRALVAAALAQGRSVVTNPLIADDSRVTREGLLALGVPVRQEPGRWIVEGRGARIAGGGEIDLGESGTSFRFLLALAALGRLPSRLDGAKRLQERPIEDLRAALNELGARIGSDWPMSAGGSVLRGGSISLPGGRSSQFASALLLIGSRLPGGLELRLLPPLVSMPYVEMTLDCLEAFGARVERPDESTFVVHEGSYPGRELYVEGDHSSASYFLAAPAIAGGRVRLEGLRGDSRQPDARLGSILEQLGCSVRRGEDWIEVAGNDRPRSFDLDLSEAPDVVPTVVVLGMFADGASRIRGVAHLRDKESDRLEMLARNLRALGRSCRLREDGLEIGARSGELRGATIQTASDHRIAMAFAVAGLVVDGVEVDDAGCVAKSHPRFWEDLERLLRI